MPKARATGGAKILPASTVSINNVTLTRYFAMTRFILLFGGLCLCSFVYSQTTVTYTSLYKKAYYLGSAQPDSAIYYAQQALKLTRKAEEQANAHYLIAYYNRKIGYYGMALQHYETAHRLHKNLQLKATILKNIAFCHHNTGNHQAAIPIARKAVRYFQQEQDSVKLMRAFNLLANCYRAEYSLGIADSLLSAAVRIAKKLKASELPNIYSDFARLEELRQAHDVAIDYQKMAVEQSVVTDTSQKVIRFARLVQLCMLGQKIDLAKQYLQQANTLKPNTLKAKIQLLAVRGLLFFFDRKNKEAYQTYRQCDSLLLLLQQNKGSAIQQKYARKTAYEVYKNAYELLYKLCLYGNKQHFTQPKNFFEQRMLREKELYEGIKVQISLKDSLIIARSTPKTKVINKIAPWWVVVIILIIIVGSAIIYIRREKVVKANIDFVKTLAGSPVKGFEELTTKERQTLEQVEALIKRKLKIEEIKVLVMIQRGSNYNQISLATGASVGAIKTRVKRLKDRCNVDNIRDLM